MSKRLIALTALTPLLVGCGALGSDGPTLRVPEGGFGIGMSHVKPGVSYASDDITLCLDKPGVVTIDRVELANPQGGLELRHFSVQESPVDGGLSYIESYQSTLWANGYPLDGPFVVTRVCEDDREPAYDGPISLLGIEVERAEDSPDEPAFQTGLVVHYTSDGDQREAFVGYNVVLCPGSVDKKPCDGHDDVRPPD